MRTMVPENRRRRLIIGAVSMVLPASPFSKGLYTFCMNGGMSVWFIRLILRINASCRKEIKLRGVIKNRCNSIYIHHSHDVKIFF